MSDQALPRVAGRECHIAKVPGYESWIIHDGNPDDSNWGTQGRFVGSGEWKKKGKVLTTDVCSWPTREAAEQAILAFAQREAASVTMPDVTELEKLLELAEKATPGEWKIRARPSLTRNPEVGNDTDVVATVWQAGMLVDGHRPNNAAFIAAARNFLTTETIRELIALLNQKGT